MAEGSPSAFSLRGKFLWLTVPVFLISAAALLAVLANQRQEELRQLKIAEARQQLERDAGLLSMPMWNLDYQAVDALAQSSVRAGRAVCVEIEQVLGAVEPLRYGDCGQRPALSAIAADVRAPGGSESIGRLHHYIDARVDAEQLISELRALLMMLGLLVIVLVACVMIAFRRLIILPLRLAQRSIRSYHQHGRYLPVPYNSNDELGEFIREFNAGLERQQQAASALQARLQLQSALNATLPLPVVAIDPQRRLREANPAFLQAFLQGNPAQVQALAAVVPELDLDRLCASDEGETNAQEIWHRSGGGSRRCYQVLAAALPTAEDAACGWLLVFQDITGRIESAQALQSAYAASRKTLQELQHAQESLIQAEKLASLGAVVAGIAHEVNTPVGSSLTVASALAGKVGEFRQQLAGGNLRRSSLIEFVDDVAEAGEILQRGLLKAADHIAKFKQVAADQTSSQRREFDLAIVIDEVLSVLRPSLRGRDIRLQLDVPDNIVMDSYPGPLGQVITNLFTNALQHGLEGRERGCIAIEVTTTRPGWVQLQVSDDGHGIDAEHQARVFDPFFTTKLGRGGTGLGLNLVYTMVSNLLGGSVAVRSKRGAGTRFIIDLPCVAPQNGEREGEHRSHA